MPRQVKNPAPRAVRTGPRVALIRLSAVGDVIHALPCATALRRAQPDAFIAWIAEPAPAQLLTRHPDLDAVITMPRRRWAKMGRRASRGERRVWWEHLRRECFDWAIDLQGLWKSAQVARGTGALERVVFGDEQARELSWWGVPGHHRIVPPPEARHVVERYLALLRPLGVTDITPEWRFGPLAEETREWLANWWPREPDFETKPWIALNPGAGWETKQWPVAHFAALAERAERDLGGRAMFLWGPADRALRDRLMQDHGGDRFFHAPDNDLHQLRALLTGCAAFVGGDTGPTHLAAALGVPCVSPHGGSDPVRNGPHGEAHVSVALSRAEVPCVPCWRTACNHSAHLACLRTLTVEMVFDALARVLARHPERARPPAALLREVLPLEPGAEGEERTPPVPRADRVQAPAGDGD